MIALGEDISDFIGIMCIHGEKQWSHYAKIHKRRWNSTSSRDVYKKIVEKITKYAPNTWNFPPPNKLGWDIQTFEWGTHKASFIGVHIALVNIVEELENTPSKGQRIGDIRKTI